MSVVSLRRCSAVNRSSQAVTVRSSFFVSYSNYLPCHTRSMCLPPISHGLLLHVSAFSHIHEIIMIVMQYADHHQLSLILDILGTPSLDDFYAISSPRSREYIRALPFRKKRPFATLFPNANPLAIDLMEKCLTFSPKKRIQVDDALKHPYLEVCRQLMSV